MTSFDERERAFENKFSHDQETLFKINVRRARLLGLWAAEQMKLPATEADVYARHTVDADVEEAGVHDIIRKVHADLTGRGIDISLHRVEKEAEALLHIAREQVTRQ